MSSAGPVLLSEPWITLTRPAVWKELVTSPAHESALELFENRTKPFLVLLFHGPPGRGKTSVANILAHRANMCFELNASEQRRIQDLIVPFSEMLNRIRADEDRTICLLMDEADGLGEGGLCMLNSYLQELEDVGRVLKQTKIRVILACNDVDKISEGVRSFCHTILFAKPSDADLVEGGRRMLDRVGVGRGRIEEKALWRLAREANGDFRALASNLQSVVAYLEYGDTSASAIMDRARREFYRITEIDVDKVSIMEHIEQEVEDRLAWATAPDAIRFGIETIARLWNRGMRSDEFATMFHDMALTHTELDGPRRTKLMVLARRVGKRRDAPLLFIQAQYLKYVKSVRDT